MVIANTDLNMVLQTAPEEASGKCDHFEYNFICHKAEPGTH